MERRMSCIVRRLTPVSNTEGASVRPAESNESAVSAIRLITIWLNVDAATTKEMANSLSVTIAVMRDGGP